MHKNTKYIHTNFKKSFHLLLYTKTLNGSPSDTHLPAHSSTFISCIQEEKRRPPHPFLGESQDPDQHVVAHASMNIFVVSSNPAHLMAPKRTFETAKPDRNSLLPALQPPLLLHYVYFLTHLSTSTSNTTCDVVLSAVDLNNNNNNDLPTATAD